MKLDKLDTVFSECMRKRAIKRSGGCERCGAQKFDIVKDNGDIFTAWKQLQCAHLISRWHKSIRWDEDAAVGLCGGCHIWIDHEDEDKQELLLKILGEEKMELLKIRARMPVRGIDKSLLVLYYRNKIKELDETKA